MIVIMKYRIGLILCFFWANGLFSQNQYTLKGNLNKTGPHEVLLKGFTVLGDSIIAKTYTDTEGNFSMQYPATYKGAALLEVKDKKSVILLLHNEGFEIKWDDLEEYKTLSFSKSPENLAFSQGFVLARQSESLLSGLNYLKSIYEQNLPNSQAKVDWITNEIKIQKNLFPDFLNALPDQSYAKYYLNLRKFLQDIDAAMKTNANQLLINEKIFNTIDFADNRLIASGLYKDLLEGYFLYLESYTDLEQTYQHINNSVDVIFKSVNQNAILKQDIAEFLFRLFEKRSHFKAAEYLALKMLSADDCQMDTKHQALFEQYRKMSKGKSAPDIVLKNTTNSPSNLSAIKSKYKLIVFGASWCNKCNEEIPKLISFYQEWKSKYNLEIVFISLDTDKENYQEFTKNFPWISSCDFKGWESTAAVDYCVFGTPTMYLLDANQTILVKPISEKQIQAWLDVNGKK